MSSASIETTLELWASSLRDVKARMRPLFGDVRVASSANQFLDGLLSDERRKTGWMRAEAAGDPGPWRQQAVLGRSHWDAEALVDIVRDYVVENLADPDVVLVIDETGFLKQGKTSCGVGRQYTGSAGKITNCQIGVFATYASRHGHAFIDRRLYMPKAWTDNPSRMAAAHVPSGTVFATKPALARQMIDRAIAADVPFSVSGVFAHPRGLLSGLRMPIFWLRVFDHIHVEMIKSIGSIRCMVGLWFTKVRGGGGAGRRKRRGGLSR
jgi:SRSO17 transposase